MFAGESFSPESEEDQSLLVNMCLKTADIANPAKSWEVYSPWIDRLFREFYAQVLFSISLCQRSRRRSHRRRLTSSVRMLGRVTEN
jgi:hypothetical protein|eukprot:SAG25_NODE_346_length_9382_cov_25.918669_6_plen_86_part_00